MVIRICVETTILLTWQRKEMREQMDTVVPNEKFVPVVIIGRRFKNLTNSTVHFLREQTVRKWREVYI